MVRKRFHDQWRCVERLDAAGSGHHDELRRPMILCKRFGGNHAALDRKSFQMSVPQI